MIDIISLIVVSVFIPLIVLTGVKVYNTKNLSNLIKGLTISFLVCEIIRFFYNAHFYENAVTPSNSLTFCFLTISCIVSLFATFNKGNIGKISKSIFCLTSFCPIIMAMFNKNLIVFELDTYSVIKALYFIECGLGISISILYIKMKYIKLNINLIYAFVFYIASTGFSIFIDYYWHRTNESVYVGNDYIAFFKNFVCLLSITIWILIVLILSKKEQNE